MHYVSSSSASSSDAFSLRRAWSAPALAALAAVFLLAVLGGAPEARAQVSGVSYTVSPTGEYVLWSDDAGLDDGFFYGGSVGLGFGQYLEVSGTYLQGDDFELDLSDSDVFEDNPDLQGIADDAQGRDVDVRRYGGRLRVNVGTYQTGGGGVVPYVSAGAGIIRFDADGADETENIYATGGVGVAFSVADRYVLSVGGEVLAYRYNPAITLLGGDLTDGDLDGTDFQQTVYNPAAHASLRIYLGGRDPDEISDLDRAFQRQFSNGLGGVRFFVEPFYGRIQFADELVGEGEGQFFRDQNVAGINAGIELGPYVGLRGFYWRGTSGRDDVFDEFGDEFQPIAFYGGELNLRFGGGLGSRSFTPYGIVGGGYADVLSDYSDEIEPMLNGANPDDRFFATLGGGLEIPLGNSLKLQGDVRSLFMSDQDAEDVSNPDRVYANLMYSAGLEFSFGGGGGPTAEELLEARAQEREASAQQRAEVMREQQRAEMDESEQVLLEEIQRLQTRLDSLERADRRETAEAEQAEQLREQLGEGEQRPRSVEERPVEERPAERPARRAAPQASGLSDRVIELPVPEVGEIYVRIGESAGSGETSVETSYAPPVIVPPSGGAAVAASPQQQQPQQQSVAGAGSTLSRDEIAGIVRQEMGRAGQDTALSRDEIANIVERTVRNELANAPNADVDQAARNAQIRQLEEQISNMRDDLDDELDDFEERQRLRESRRPSEVVVEDGGDEEDQITTVSSRSAYAPNRIVPVAGFAFGDGQRFLIGVRGDYGSDIGSDAGFRFMPEASVGFGDGVGLDLLANLVYDFDQDLIGNYFGSNDFAPYVGAGVGVASETGLGVNLLGGLEYDTSSGSLFLEYSTVSFFDYNRVLIGIRTQF